MNPPAQCRRLIIAHLGNGASITAVQDGASVDTTMGFSPTGGLMMGTRSGDLDPMVLIYLARTHGCDVDTLQQLVDEQAGLLGVSGVSSDVRDLLEHPASPTAAEAIELFCYIARKHIGALAAVLGGIDTLVFTGGIGEHAPVIRDSICQGLGHLGIHLDPERNAANQDSISRPQSPVVVRVVATNEELMIARHMRAVLA
jgi:acetate kinase